MRERYLTKKGEEERWWTDSERCVAGITGSWSERIKHCLLVLVSHDSLFQCSLLVLSVFFSLALFEPICSGEDEE